MNHDYQASRRQIAEDAAHAKRDLRSLLIPYFRFRVTIKFFPTPGGRVQQQESRTFYGHEHDCTYNQCVAGHFPFITMNRSKGYDELLKLVEKNYAGKYSVAKIWGRPPGAVAFTDLHRIYYNGKIQKGVVQYNGEDLQLPNDPVIDVADQLKKLFYKVEGGKVFVLENDPNS